MTLSTHPEDRREMVRALSERLQTPAIYLRTPTYAFRIGKLTVNRDGSIASEDEALLESLRPMLIEHGWLEEEPDEQPATTAEENSEAADDPKEARDEQIEAADDQDDMPAEQVVITTPLTDWTVPQLTNLLRTLYARQHLLNRMMQGETLYIAEPVVEEITDNPPTDAADFKARVQRAVEDGARSRHRLRGRKAEFQHAILRGGSHALDDLPEAAGRDFAQRKVREAHFHPASGHAGERKILRQQLADAHGLWRFGAQGAAARLTSSLERLCRIQERGRYAGASGEVCTAAQRLPGGIGMSGLAQWIQKQRRQKSEGGAKDDDGTHGAKAA